MIYSNHIGRQQRRRKVVVFLAIALLSGCGKGRPERVPVSGSVLIDSKPLPDASVQFVPTEGRTAYGRTNQEGLFTLGSYEKNDGVALGTHRVVVVAAHDIDGSTTQWNAPKKYSNHKSSGLEFVIDKPVSDLKIELSWDGGKPFIERNGKVVKGGN